MAIKLGNTNINALGNNWNKAYLGNDLVFDGVSAEYYLDLDSTQQDYLSIINAELNTDVPSTGVFEYGGVFTIPSVNPSQTTGMMGRLLSGATVPERYGFYLTSIGNLTVTSQETSTTLQDFILNFGGQKVEICVRFEGADMVLLVNNIEQRRIISPRPTTGTSTFFMGAYANSDGLTPRSGRYYNGFIHSFFIGDEIWECNEGSGNFVESKTGGYKSGIFTSNLSPTYIDDFMWQLLNP